MRPSPLSPILQEYHTQVISRFAPKTTLKWKSDSAFMKFLGAVMFFNPQFMSYITTIGHTIYVPDEWQEMSQARQFQYIAHESVHIYDTTKESVFFGLLYLFPHFVFPLIAIGLAFVSPWFLLLSLLAILPLPAPFRFNDELRGYRMNLLLMEKAFGVDKASEHYQEALQNMINVLTGPAYYFTMPFPGYVKKKFKETGWEQEEIYKWTLEFAQTFSV